MTVSEDQKTSDRRGKDRRIKQIEIEFPDRRKGERRILADRRATPRH